MKRITYFVAGLMLAITAGVVAQQSNIGGLAARLKLTSLGIGTAAPAGTGNLTATGTVTAATINASAGITGAAFSGDGSLLTALNASNLASGTVPDARFPATLPAASGANLTALNASNLSSGTVPDARFPATLPAASGVNLTALNATNLASGTVPDARFPATLPAASGVNLTALNATNLASGTVPDARLSANVPLLPVANIFTASDPTINFVSVIPSAFFNESDALTNNRVWSIGANGESFAMQVVNDDATTDIAFMRVERTGLTVDSLNLIATAVQTNGVEITASAGTFTATFTGFSSPPSGNLAWTKHGGLACLNSQSQMGTSNATTFTITNIPVEIRPTGLTGGYARLVNNGSNVAAGTWTLSGGTMILENGHGSPSGWTASGSKGINGQSFCWNIASF